MALTISKQKPLNAVKIISKNDDAIDMEASNWEKYEETLDPAHLKVLPGKQPTILLCNFETNAKDAAMIKNAIMQGTDDEGKPKVGLGSWQLAVTRVVLKDIQNPDYVPEDERIVLKKDGRCYVDEATLNKLSRVGVVAEIFNHFVSHTEKDYRKEAKNS